MVRPSLALLSVQKHLKQVRVEVRLIHVMQWSDQTQRGRLRLNQMTRRASIPILS